MAKLSVVVPMYNEEDSIAHCLERLLAMPEIDEIVLVDNNSRDNTVDIVHRFCENTDRITLLFEPRQGVAFARKTGFDAANGEIIGGIDADTRVEPGWAEAARSYFESEAGADIGAVWGVSYLYDSPLERTQKMVQDRLIKKFAPDKLRADYLCGNNMAIRKTAWVAVRDKISLRPELQDDIELAMCVWTSGFTIAWLTTMRAKVSGRRNATPPWKFVEYLLSARRAVALHRNVPIGYDVRLTMEWLSHIAYWMVTVPWDPATRRFSLRYLLSSSQSRPVPSTMS